MADSHDIEEPAGLVRDVDGVIVPGVVAARRGVPWLPMSVGSLSVLGGAPCVAAAFVAIVVLTVAQRRRRGLRIRALDIGVDGRIISAEHLRACAIRPTLMNGSTLELETTRGTWRIATRRPLEEVRWLKREIEAVIRRWEAHAGRPPADVERLMRRADAD